MGVAMVGDLKPSSSAKRIFRQSFSARHGADWSLSDGSGDLIVEVGTQTFSLHKLPLVSRSGKIRKLLLSEARETKAAAGMRISLPAVPGGAEAFELAAKFCYGVNVEVNLSNVAMLLCAAHHLQMTEDFSGENLESLAEAYLTATVLPSAARSAAVLRHSEALLPAADEINLVGRLVSEIAATLCREQVPSELRRDSPATALAELSLDFFRRILSAMKTRGASPETVTGILIHYAHHHSPHGLAAPPDGEAEQPPRRALVETLVALLPPRSRRSRAVPVAFLSGLLKAGAAASASAACRADVERRMALQLDQAALEDILLPASSAAGGGGVVRHQLYDTETTLRIFSLFLRCSDEKPQEEDEDDDDGHRSPAKQSSLRKVTKLMDGYLAEVALDSNLPPAKFIALAELLPDHARLVGDGLYRAIDIFLKVHPNMKEAERYRLCKAIDCRKLSPEACGHAAQNERLPVQTAVQVLYFEQLRLRSAMNHDQSILQWPGHRGGSAAGGGSGAASPRDSYALVRRENRELRQEVARMRMRLTELERDHVSMKQELVRAGPTSGAAGGVLRSLGRALAGKLHEIFRERKKGSAGHGAGSVADPRPFFLKRRRHSVS
ncbi:unnamed protein product [Spirodela intermedia]|uniref:Uncharacterized protein n=1 Tax=Spirodela intermedia TaxID=51605 RepID=A0A7I8KSK9_SPIIN|nr:unnamed protein product [Spirodela intermedia]